MVAAMFCDENHVVTAWSPTKPEGESKFWDMALEFEESSKKGKKRNETSFKSLQAITVLYSVQLYAGPFTIAHDS